MAMAAESVSPTRRSTIATSQERWSALLDEELEQETAEQTADAKPLLFSLAAALGGQDGQAEKLTDSSAPVVEPSKTVIRRKGSKQPVQAVALPVGVVSPSKAAAVELEAESPDVSPKRSRRRRQKTVGTPGGTAAADEHGRKELSSETAITAASPMRSRRSKQNTSSELNRSEMRKAMMSEVADVAASALPCRARGGPRGILGTDSVPMHGGHGDAFTRGFAGNVPMPAMRPTAMPLHPYQPQLATGMATSGVLSTPGSPCRPNRSAGSILSTSTSPCAPPPLSRQMGGQTTPMVFMPCMGNAAPSTPAQPNCAPVVTSAARRMEEQAPMNDILKSVLGHDTLRFGHDLAAQLLAAAPDVYED